MATMSTERPGFWRAPRNYHPKPRPQSCVWSPPSHSSYDTNSLPRQKVHFYLPEEQVQSGSPASDAGLRTGDVLLSIGNTSTLSPPMTHSTASDMIKHSGNTLNVQVQRPQGRSPAPMSPSISPVYSSEPPSSHTPYRPVPMNRGVIPHISPGYESSIRKPENNTEEYLKEKAREQWAITAQTYRTLPLIEPRPKVRRDWPTGSYLRYMDGPSWHDLPKTAVLPQPQKLQNVMHKFGQGVTQNNPGVVHLQYNSPINVYSDENVANVLTPRPVSPRPGQAVPPPVVHIKNQLQKPLTVDITQSPTYQLLQEEEEESHREYDAPKDRLYTVGSGQHSGPGHSPKYSPIGQHSPSYPIQTPYFRSLMNSLLPNPGI
jgi:hypothetical protein